MPVATSSTIAARPRTPLPSRSNGSSSARIVSSGIASISPSPNTGSGTRRANTLASSGAAGWHLCGGTEKRCISVLPSRSSPTGPASVRYPARVSAITLVPPMAGTLWHTAQLVPLNAGPRPSSAASTSRKSSRPRRNSSNSTGVIPASGRPNGCDCVPALATATTNTASAATMALMTPSLRDERAAHERVARAAQPRTLEDVPSRLRRRERRAGDAASAFRNDDVDVGLEETESVIRVVAAKADLDGRVGLHADLGRTELETLRGDLDDLRLRLKG